MAINVVLNEKVPVHKDVVRIRLQNLFYDSSFIGGPDYKNSKDAQGLEVFIPHEQESDTNVARRKRLATYRNYCRPIIERFNNLIFTSPIQRDTSNVSWSEWCKDVDMNSMNLHGFMRNVVLQSQKFGKFFVLIDSTKKDETQTVAQSRAAGNRLYLIPIHPDSVVNWEDENGSLSEIVISFKDNEYIHYTKDYTQRFNCNDDNYVTSIDLPVVNPLGLLSVVKVVSRNDDLSQIRDVAELNKIVFNLDSLLLEELYRNTFSQIFITGIKTDDLDNVNVSGRKVITIAKPDAKVNGPIGADASQAASIRDSLHVYEKEIYRAAGLQQPDVVQNTESGRALKLRMNESQQIAADIADQAEKAENYITNYWSKALNIVVKPCDYPEEFNTEDMEIELKMTLDMLKSSLPKTVKDKQIVSFTKQLFPKISQDEMNEILTELENQPEAPMTPAHLEQDEQGEIMGDVE